MNLNENIFTLRSKTIQFYKDYARIIKPILKFILMTYCLMSINRTIGYSAMLSSPIIAFGIALITMFFPTPWLSGVIIGVAIIHLSTYSLIIGGIGLVIALALYVFYIRLYPKESLLIILTAIGMELGFACMIPMITALFFGLNCIVPIGLGIVLYELSLQIPIMIQNEIFGQDIIGALMEFLMIIEKRILLNPMVLAYIGISVIVYMTVFIIRKQSLDYAAYLAIGIGAFMNLLGFGMSILFLELPINVLMLFVMTIISAGVAIVAQFMGCVVDYNQAETVQFEDEDYVYYVKIVPKIKVSGKKIKIEQVFTETQQEYGIDEEIY